MQIPNNEINADALLPCHSTFSIISTATLAMRSTKSPKSAAVKVNFNVDIDINRINFYNFIGIIYQIRVILQIHLPQGIQCSNKMFKFDLSCKRNIVTSEWTFGLCFRAGVERIQYNIDSLHLVFRIVPQYLINKKASNKWRCNRFLT